MDPISLLNRTPARIAARFRPQTRFARAVRPLVDRLVPDEPKAVVVRSGPARGLEIVIEARREKFYWTGAHEPSVQAALVERLRPGMCVWDVGAHVGFFSLLAARLVGPTGEVRAFEPVASNRERLEQAAALNGFGHLIAHPEAVGARIGEASFYRHTSTLMGSTVNGDSRQVVSQVTLDALAERLGPPGLVKIDVEGAELDVLQGGGGILLSVRPDLIVELDGRVDPRALRAAAGGYAVRPLDDRHWLLLPRERP